MLRHKGCSWSRLQVLFLALLLFSISGATWNVAAQDTPPEAATDRDQLPHAEEVLAAGLAEAEKDDRLVFLHTGADW